MSAVRIEGKAWADPRIAAMAAIGHMEIDECIGRLARLWLWCTEKETYVVPSWLVWSIVKIKDVDFVAVELGEWADDELTLIRVKGTKGRIEWLGERRAASKAGGEATRRKYETTQGQTGAKAEPNDSQTIAKAGPNGGPLTLSLTLDPVRSESKTPKVPTGDVSDSLISTKRGRPRKPRAGEPTEAESESVRVVLGKLGDRNGVAYTGSRPHVQLIVGRLRDGIPEMDLRKVIGYCASKLGWADDPKMRPFLRPETLFGPETIGKYLYAARAWFDELPSDGASS